MPRVRPWVTVLAAQLLVAAHGSSPAVGGDRSLLDPGKIKRAVANKLEWQREDDRLVLVGETDDSARYQMSSEDIALRHDTVAIRLELAGEIVRGGLYVGLLDTDGQFLQPVLTLGQGSIVTDGFVVPTLGSQRVRLVLGNATGGSTSSWRIERLDLEELAQEPTWDLEFRAADLGRLPPALRRPVVNSLQLVRSAEGIVLAGETDRSQRYQLLSAPMPVEPDTALIRTEVVGRVIEGRVFHALLDGQGSFLGPVRYAGPGTGFGGGALVDPGQTETVSWVLGNAADGASSELEISAVHVEKITVELRAAAVREHAVARSFQGSAWVWAWRVLLGALQSVPSEAEPAPLRP